MQKVFDDVNALDKRCVEQFGLSEDVLMEHAAMSMLQYIQGQFANDEKVLIVCGVGNNGADGLALARLLYSQYDVSVFMPYPVKSVMAKLQLKRAKALGINIIDSLSELLAEQAPAVIVDCLFGSGLNRDLNVDSQRLLNRLNALSGYKIACDMPSGLNQLGQVTSIGFNADITITMGALKTQLYSDRAKDQTGNIIVSNLGVQRNIYEMTTNTFLLDPEDMKRPLRLKQDSHKGTFGHVGIVVGDKPGAGMLAAEAAYAFGAGLVTVITEQVANIPYYIMQKSSLPANCTAFAIGMGLGQFKKMEVQRLLSSNIPKVIDADLCHDDIILTILNDENVVLTPHPKEFCALLKLSGLADITVPELQSKRFIYIKRFADKYPKTVLLLKGAYSLITYNNITYINPLGTNALSKGGSGDVLAGLIVALLAQGYSAINAALTASLAHSISAADSPVNNYALTPVDIIEGIKVL